MIRIQIYISNQRMEMSRKTGFRRKRKEVECELFLAVSSKGVKPDKS